MNCETEATLPAVDRRQLLKAGAVGLATATMTSSAARAQEDRAAVRAEAFAQTHQPRPLPFDPATLNGLSQRLIDSHWSNNYGGSVQALNETKRRLAAALADPDLPAYIYNDLKREHLMRTGSVLRLEWRPAKKGLGGVVTRQIQMP